MGNCGFGPKATAFEAEDARESVLRNADILRLLFKDLDLEDLLRASATCRVWFKVSQSEEFWGSLDFSGRKVRARQAMALVCRHTSLHSLNMKGVKHLDEVWQDLLRAIPGLQHLTMGSGLVTEHQLYQPGVLLGNLQEWVLQDAHLGVHLGSFSGTEATITHPSLPKLHLKRCMVGRLTVRCQSLETLEMQSSTVTNLHIQCPQLRTMCLRDCQKLSDANFRIALSNLSSVVHLDLTACVPLSDDTLREVGRTCRSVRTLIAAKCPGITLNSMHGFPELRHLDLTGCEGIAPGTAVPALERWTNLETLVLDWCDLLNHLTLSMPRLKKISLRHCKMLTSVDLHCGWLEEILVGREESSPRHFDEHPLRRVTVCSDAMRRMQWRGCHKLEQMLLACSYLQEAEFLACQLLCDDMLLTMGDAGKGALLTSRGVQGACPRLRSLIVSGNRGLRQPRLISQTLQSLSLSSCSNLDCLYLSCPQLKRLQASLLIVEDCNSLQAVEMHVATMTHLALGSCPQLEVLSLRAPALIHLDLQGCGMLGTLTLDCPRLESLDATFCYRLGNNALAWIPRCRPPLQRLFLGLCTQIDAQALHVLSSLGSLRSLDLSYTEIKNLEPVLRACPELQKLNLASCALLGENALDALLPAGARGSPIPSFTQELKVRELDVSYCNLPTSIITSLLTRATTLEVLAINGCGGATSEIWDAVHGLGVPELPLQTLSAVGCKRLRSCWLGLQPARPADRETQQALLSVGMYSPPVPVSTGWQEVPVALTNLRTLRLGLSGVRSLALALPALTALDMNNAAELRCLELRCPLLLTVHMQACKMLPGPSLERTMEGCRRLEVLDAQHSDVPAGASARLHEACPALRTLLQTDPVPQPSPRPILESPEPSESGSTCY